MQIRTRRQQARMSRRVADFGQRAATSQGVRDESVVAVVDSERSNQATIQIKIGPLTSSLPSHRNPC